MQIHEVTLPSEFIGNLAKQAGTGLVQGGKALGQGLAQTGKVLGKGIAQSTIGQDIAGAITDPIKKAGAVLSTPGAMTDPHAYRDAMNKYRSGQVAELEPRVQQKLAGQIAQKTQQRAKELAQDWVNLVKSKQPRARLKSAPTPIKPTGQYATKPTPPGQVYGSNYPTRYNPPPPKPGQLPMSEQDDAIKGNVAGKPTAAEYEKLQQRIAAASGASTPPTEPPKPEPAQTTAAAPAKTGFAAVAGPTPPPGGQVSSKVTATPRTILTGSRAREFETWAAKQLTSTIPGTRVAIGLEQIKKDPATRQSLNTALTNIIRGNNDPKAVEQYFTIAMQAMQRLSATLKQSGQVSSTRAATNPTASGVLDRYVEPVAAQKLRDLARNPTYAEILKKELGIT